MPLFSATERKMKTNRDLKLVAADLARVLGFYEDAYKGSPYREEAQSALSEYYELQAEGERLNNLNLDSWSRVESAVMSVLMDEDKSLSEQVDQAREIVEIVKRVGIGKDVDQKLNKVIAMAESLKSVPPSLD